MIPGFPSGRENTTPGASPNPALTFNLPGIRLIATTPIFNTLVSEKEENKSNNPISDCLQNRTVFCLKAEDLWSRLVYNKIYHPNKRRVTGLKTSMSFEFSKIQVKMSQCYQNCEITGGPAGPGRPQKDYSRPLHVDCSVEYELPNAAKPPAGTKSEPLLMIHPCYYRRAESQRRSPFINNLPSRGSGMVGASRRSSQVARLAPPQPPYPVRVVEQAAARAEAVMALLWPEGPPPLYTKPVRPAGKRDPLLCGGDFSSGSDSGISAGHWTDSDRSPLAPEIRLQRDFQVGPDSGIATPVSLAEDKTVLSNRQAIQQQPVSYQQAPCTPCSCGKSQCMVPSYDTSKSIITNCENQYLPPSYEQTSFQAPGLSQYSQSQLQQWLQSVQVSLSPQRRRVAPAPPQMHRYGIVSPIVIH